MAIRLHLVTRNPPALEAHDAPSGDPGPAVDGAPSPFAVGLAHWLAGIGELGPEGEDLTLALGLSSWMRRSGVDLATARAAMHELRRRIVVGGGLDSASEPVPLPLRDQRRAVLALLEYLHDLLERGAQRSGTSRRAVVEVSLALSAA